MIAERRDTLRIEDLMVYARIGVTQNERAYPQRLLLSAAVEADLQNAIEAKDVSQGLCYASLADSIVETASTQEWVLVEELAEEISSLIFQNFPAALALHLTIKKFAVPGCAWVGIEIQRTRQ
jgi:FolB domain-containing protein